MQWNYILKTLKFTIISQFILNCHQYTWYCQNSTWQISVQNVISSLLILIPLFVPYSLISFNFYLFYFPGAAAEPLGLRGAQVGNLWFKVCILVFIISIKSTLFRREIFCFDSMSLKVLQKCLCLVSNPERCCPVHSTSKILHAIPYFDMFLVRLGYIIKAAADIWTRFSSIAMQSR